MRPTTQNIVFAVIGAVIGSVGGLAGLIAGGIVSGVGAHILLPLLRKGRLKSQILRSVEFGPPMQLKDLIALHGIPVPMEAFDYSDTHPYVVTLVAYRSAILELETEQRIVHAVPASRVLRLVEPSSNWVNDWSGRAYMLARGS
jgi:hypothetical protein